MSSKISIATIVSDHWKTLRNNNTGRVSWTDLLIFILIPTALSIALYCYKIILNAQLANVLATAFSIFAALLFNLLLLVYDLLKKEESSSAPNRLRQDLLDEVSKNISFTILLSLLVIILLIINSFELKLTWAGSLLAAATFWLSTIFLLTLFMVLKRIHNLLVTAFPKKP